MLETLRSALATLKSAEAQARRVVDRYWLLESHAPCIETEATMWADHTIAEV